MENLPEELLCRIFRNIDRTGDIQRLPLVNKKWARIATSVLYEIVSLYHEPYQRQNQTLRKLLNTLISSPTSRPLARHLVIGHWKTTEANVYNPDIPSTSLAEFNAITQCLPALASCSIGFQRKFGVDLLNSSLDALLTAVLNLLPNLVSLSLSVNRNQALPQRPGPFLMTAPSTFHDNLAMRFIALSATQSLASFPLFSRLSCVQISEDILAGNGAKVTAGWDTNVISLFLPLPTLKTFVGHGCCDLRIPTTWACDERASSVNTIYLYNCRLGAESLRKILRACKALEIFVCSRICQQCCTTVQLNFDYDSSYASIDHELFHHRDSLETLHLASTSCWHAVTHRDEPIETLFAFDELRHLVIDQAALFGFINEPPPSLDKFFPSNLHEVVILGDSGQWQDELLFKIGRALLSNATLPTVDFYRTCVIFKVEEILKQLPGIAIEVTSERAPDDSYNFRMYKVEVEEEAMDSVDED